MIGPLISGGEDALHAHLRPLIDRAQAVDLSVSFLMASGVRLVLPHLRDLLDRGGQLRLLTGDYLGVTEPAALRLIADLEGERRLHVFQAAQIPFHPKAWMFTFTGDGGALIVGIVEPVALGADRGIEWNLRHVDPVDPAPLAGRPHGLRGAAGKARGHRADAQPGSTPTRTVV
jgi:HKD family nuclease